MTSGFWININSYWKKELQVELQAVAMQRTERAEWNSHAFLWQLIIRIKSGAEFPISQIPIEWR